MFRRTYLERFDSWRNFERKLPLKYHIHWLKAHIRHVRSNKRTGRNRILWWKENTWTVSIIKVRPIKGSKKTKLDHPVGRGSVSYMVMKPTEKTSYETGKKKRTLWNVLNDIKLITQKLLQLVQAQDTPIFLTGKDIVNRVHSNGFIHPTLLDGSVWLIAWWYIITHVWVSEESRNNTLESKKPRYPSFLGFLRRHLAGRQLWVGEMLWGLF